MAGLTVRDAKPDIEDTQDAQPTMCTSGRSRSCTLCTPPAALSRMGSSFALLDLFDTPEFLGARRATTFINPVSTSVFDIFKIGIGPSSSHTVGPMIACRNFTKQLVADKMLHHISHITVELRGSLALTGIGHCTNKAVVLGLHGVAPSEVDPTGIDSFLAEVKECGKMAVGFGHEFIMLDFDEERDVILVADELPLHPNAMICQAFAADGTCLKEVRYYSTGGGFVFTGEEMLAGGSGKALGPALPIPFTGMSDLLRVCEASGLDIAGVMHKNEEARRSPEQVQSGLKEIWSVMEQCVDLGLRADLAGEVLPGPLGLQRRAPGLYKHAKHEQEDTAKGIQAFPAGGVMDELRWLDCYALAVMEENAGMGRVVTAPTNGSAGVVPAVLTYFMRHLRDKQPEDKRQGPTTFLLTAAVAGILAKEHAFISGAAGGCQAAVGTATAMAAAGLCAALNGTPAQVEEAAEIAMEDSLGMTCDPILGLVQVPCIERNTMGASRALNAVALVLKSPLTQRRSMLRYDDVLRVMKETGKDMDSRYRETAQGGLAADYERSLENDPELRSKVLASMGFDRVRHGTRQRTKREVTYEELAAQLITERTSTQSLSKC
ncbi:unnamed protein product [Polarella glacialis]|uniref:L-serine ammonia-lyase n=1 Tax=Polarella glacialis TaxID=89957 RepID=A0A813HJM2_POLGL|nr:unnamed protein product [Polarella glacialis]